MNPFIIIWFLEIGFFLVAEPVEAPPSVAEPVEATAVMCLRQSSFRCAFDRLRHRTPYWWLSLSKPPP